jgi:hypothetical protein
MFGVPDEIQTPTCWNLIGRSMTARPHCYRPAVFFRQLHLIALSFQQGNKIGSRFKNISLIFFLLFFLIS